MKFSVMSVLFVVLFLVGSVCAQQTSILNSLHNLSATGPGSVRAVAEQEVCIFCHTPHNASPIQPLWNRSTPANAYTVYSSTSLQAKPGQPTGSSKLCLSCHDGTIAVGSVLSRNQLIAMAGGITTLPPGHSNIGTDLSDDHPVSFRYDSNLAVQDPKLKPPTALPAAVKLDKNQELQCTSCHDAHNNVFGKFLVMDNTNSQLCNSCHQASDTTIAAHVQCASCHQIHTAPSGPMLLKGVDSTQACLSCHSSVSGENQGQDISSELNKISRHFRPHQVAPMTPEGGSETVASESISCASCHESHTMQTGTAAAPLISPKLGKVSGTTAAGGKTIAAQFEYEVCFKCHNDSAVVQPRIPRLVVQNNTRLEFASSAVSFHPVTAAGKNTDVPSLRTSTLTSASIINCTDCHSSDTGKSAGGSGPNGPHGSSASPLLAAQYSTTDNTPESATTYALCYKCHDRTSILNNESFSGHSLHVQQQNTPCSVCHDAHGISSTQGTGTNHAHLMNFDTSVVFPDPITGRIEYRSLGPRIGECTLSCHGVAHSPKQYPAQGDPLAPAGLRLLRSSPAVPVAPSRVTPSRRAAPRTR